MNPKNRLLRTPSGFRDISAEQSALKQWIVRNVSEAYTMYGFSPLETPCVEFTETLIGEQTDFNLFKVESSKEREGGKKAEERSLRFDMTVPLARYICQNNPKLPFKRWTYGPVFRGESPGAGRYRQFDQFDADSVGVKGVESDAEILLVMSAVMTKIIGSAFTIKINSRKILNELQRYANFDNSNLEAVLVILDKKTKITKEEMVLMLQKIQLEKSSIDKILLFSDVSGFDESIKFLVANEFAAESIDEISELKNILSVSRSMNNFEFNFSIIRGLGYYTGIIFETTLNGAEQFGSVYSGGRYDNLTTAFNGQSIPAVGASVGIDRLLTALEYLHAQNKFVNPVKESVGVLVCVLDKKVLSYAFEISESIRRQDSICEVYLGKSIKLSDQISYAESKRYEKILIIGEKEAASRNVTIKNITNQNHISVPFDSQFTAGHLWESI